MRTFWGRERNDKDLDKYKWAGKPNEHNNTRKKTPTIAELCEFKWRRYHKLSFHLLGVCECVHNEIVLIYSNSIESMQVNPIL